ncbi:Serine threonine kinase nrc-2, putative [Babesia ovata]|uniref:Serine threonine kinase nrc-2, putative n=1 Tax=Babesia ovata TaxID=189622 RepID=A0A2H6K717_9APIC|nr:Serine threonine kinase nrc-2, putative [Babesia ovata]GBE58775.1 Serine threonine kinase nrc-2, putative [Babesia ovata]
MYLAYVDVRGEHVTDIGAVAVAEDDELPVLPHPRFFILLLVAGTRPVAHHHHGQALVARTTEEGVEQVDTIQPEGAGDGGRRAVALLQKERSILVYGISAPRGRFKRHVADYQVPQTAARGFRGENDSVGERERLRVHVPRHQVVRLVFVDLPEPLDELELLPGVRDGAQCHRERGVKGVVQVLLQPREVVEGLLESVHDGQLTALRGVPDRVLHVRRHGVHPVLFELRERLLEAVHVDEVLDAVEHDPLLLHTVEPPHHPRHVHGAELDVDLEVHQNRFGHLFERKHLREPFAWHAGLHQLLEQHGAVPVLHAIPEGRAHSAGERFYEVLPLLFVALVGQYVRVGRGQQADLFRDHAQQGVGEAPVVLHG